MTFHIDGNSFYASCERVFRPDLYKSPIAVLSNNDGIIVAANAECRALGFKRGDVFHKNRQRMEKLGVKVFSSNYTLYADMSARMNLIYNRLAPEVETYSIDESFLFYPDWKNADYTQIADDLKKTVTKETGISVSVGVAPNKTLAKICNRLAKKREVTGRKQGIISTPGVCNWLELNHDEVLALYPASDVWGIGYSKAAFLLRHGIDNALKLKHYPLHKAKKHLTINGFRTVQELNGIAAIGKIEDSSRQIIMVSRSFQAPVFELDDIITALSAYTQEAVKRLRAGRLSCRCVSVYLMTNSFAGGDQYFNQTSIELTQPSACLPEINGSAIDLLKRMYRPHYKYRKVMIALSGLSDGSSLQPDMFDDRQKCDKRYIPLMQAFDSINDRYGRGTIKLAPGLNGAKPKPQGAETSPWETRRDFLSPNYTTKIGEVPAAK